MAENSKQGTQKTNSRSNSVSLKFPVDHIVHPVPIRQYCDMPVFVLE